MACTLRSLHWDSMRLQGFVRVVYRHNPIVEVVCQARFIRMTELTNPEGLLSDLASLGYSVNAVGSPINIQIRVTGTVVANAEPAPVSQPLKNYAFASVDGVWTIAFNAESITLMCRKDYPGWNAFLPRFIELTNVYRKWFQGAKTIRLGLRYKDIIDREALNLAGVPWHELVEPFLLGALSVGALADDEVITEEHVRSSLTQAAVRLDECSLGLNSALMRAALDPAKTIFLIDADFFKQAELEGDLAATNELLQSNLEVLHDHAGAMFRRGIKERLHDALGPTNGQ